MKRINLLIFIGMVAMSMAVVGCHNGNAKQDNTVTQGMEVRTVGDTVFISKESSDSGIDTRYEMGAEVDIPVDGPQPLTDSIRWFVTKELYGIFDWEDDEERIHIPFEKVYEWNGENIVTDFINHYGPLYNDYAMGIGANYMTLRNVAQTETFVTYYAEYVNCGASCNYDYAYYTFCKKDGHLLKNIVSNENLSRFSKKYPQYDVDVDVETSFVGLSDKGFLYGSYIPFGPEGGLHKMDTIPYVKIKPYLSKEAQELLSKI